MEVRWENLTPPEFKHLAREEKLCIVPVGSLERHGEHMPYGTDTVVAHTIACRAAQMEPCVVFPPYWFGQVHEAAAFAGTINFPAKLLIEMLETLLDQIAQNGFKKILLLNGHGGNSAFLDFFGMAQLDRKVDYTLYTAFDLGPKLMKACEEIMETPPMNHACEGETSLAMACFPEGTVKPEQQFYPEPVEPKIDLSHLQGVKTPLWWYAMYPENVTGYPSKASREKGEAMMEVAVKELAEKIRAVKEDDVVPALHEEFYRRVRKVSEL